MKRKSIFTIALSAAALAAAQLAWAGQAPGSLSDPDVPKPPRFLRTRCL
jgi:hypothetical protein